jgi:hypothetical protein
VSVYAVPTTTFVMDRRAYRCAGEDHYVADGRSRCYCGAVSGVWAAPSFICVTIGTGAATVHVVRYWMTITL